MKLNILKAVQSKIKSPWFFKKTAAGKPQNTKNNNWVFDKNYFCVTAAIIYILYIISLYYGIGTQQMFDVGLTESEFKAILTGRYWQLCSSSVAVCCLHANTAQLPVRNRLERSPRLFMSVCNQQKRLSPHKTERCFLFPAKPSLWT